MKRVGRMSVGMLAGLGLVVGVSVGCASRERVPLGEVMPRTDSTPIVDRYARARLILLDEINADRAEQGVAPVGLDSLATVVAQQHADAMAKEGYLSHYESDGSAPYERFGEAGGVAHVRENVFRWSRRPDDPRDRRWAWPEFDIREAERWFMGSPGHRATILDPSRTHVGIGVAEDRERGAVFVVQEFIARHAWIDAPQVAWSRAPTTIRGRMLGAGTRPLLLFVSREPDVDPWVGDVPPRGSYLDGSHEGVLVPPWKITWNWSDRSFEVHLDPAALGGPGRYYGIVYVAPEERVWEALGVGRVNSNEGYPGASFILDVL